MNKIIKAGDLVLVKKEARELYQCMEGTDGVCMVRAIAFEKGESKVVALLPDTTLNAIFDVSDIEEVVGNMEDEIVAKLHSNLKPAAKA